MDGEMKERMRENYIREEKRKMRKIGLIAAVIFAVGFFFLGKEFPLDVRIPFALSFGWMGYNMGTYRGRYRPRILYAIKIGYPVLLFMMIMIAIGKF